MRNSTPEKENNAFCVLIRVYNRMQDLEICVEAIRKYWKSRNYFLLVVSNGLSDGYKVPESVKKSADHVVEISKNAGHQKGNSQLLLHGILISLSPVLIPYCLKPTPGYLVMKSFKNIQKFWNKIHTCGQVRNG